MLEMLGFPLRTQAAEWVHRESACAKNKTARQPPCIKSSCNFACEQSEFAGPLQGSLSPFMVVNSSVRTDFRRSPQVSVDREVYNVNAVVRTMCLHGRFKEALQVLEHQSHHSLQSEIVVFLLQQCIKMKGLAEGKQVYSHIVKIGLSPKTFIGNQLVNMYINFGNMTEARQIFDIMPKRDVVSWTLMIAGYAQQGLNEEALSIFQGMQVEGVDPDKITFACVLNVCTHLGALEQGREIHDFTIQNGFELDVMVGSALVDMYAKCGSLELGQRVFNRMPSRNVVTWTALMGGYSQVGKCEDALKCFQQMQESTVEPDKVTCICALKACTNLAAIEAGEQIHALIIKHGFELDAILGSTLVDMYAGCGCLEKAQQVFDKLPNRTSVSWNVMITRYALHGNGEKALELFWKMEHEKIYRDEVACTSALKACAGILALDQGKGIHTYIVESGIGLDVFLGSALVHMYAKCRSIEIACQVFNKMPKRDLVLWNTMIAGYSESGNGNEAWQVFCQMKMEGIEPNYVSYVTLLKACSSIAALKLGSQIHVHIIQSGFESIVMVANALINMHAKCGNIQHARLVFDKMLERDVASWNVMITGYALHGKGKEIVQLLEQMQCSNVKVDPVTCSSILSACSHTGLFEEGCLYFKSMRQFHGILPTVIHYACVVDLLGRSGHLKEATSLIEDMPFQTNTQVWTALLGACRTTGDTELAQLSVERILELDPGSPSAYVLLSNIYAMAGQCADAPE